MVHPAKADFDHHEHQIYSVQLYLSLVVTVMLPGNQQKLQKSLFPAKKWSGTQANSHKSTICIFLHWFLNGMHTQEMLEGGLLFIHLEDNPTKFSSLTD